MNAQPQPIRSREISVIRQVLDAWSQALKREESGASAADDAKFTDAARRAEIQNPWFTRDNVILALDGLAHMLREEAVEKWLDMYPTDPPSKTKPKRVALVAAGNVPMVGFHDLLTTLVGGHRPVVKLSGQDSVLLPALFGLLAEGYSPDLFPVEFTTGKLPEFDAVIATGSNNTSRYFKYYFGRYPHIIRKSRSSVAVLTGAESPEELHALGADIFSYFGLGCRNVSKIFVPRGFEIDRIFEAIHPYHEIVNHHKYANNYDYYKATWLLNNEKLLDNGFVIFRETDALGSPVGSVNLGRYDDPRGLNSHLAENAEMIQCTVSREAVPFGGSQKPELWDYADGVDTMEFIRSLL